LGTPQRIDDWRSKHLTDTRQQSLSPRCALVCHWLYLCSMPFSARRCLVFGSSQRRRGAWNMRCHVVSTSSWRC